MSSTTPPATPPSSTSASFALAALLLATSGAALAAACTVGDQSCPDDTREEDRDDRCPYGPPGGPQKSKAVRECPLVEFDYTNCTVEWERDVYPILIARDGGNCASPGCHGPGTLGGAKMLIPPDVTPSALYATLTSYTNAIGDPYVGAETPTSWFLCNLFAEPGGGVPMPYPSGLVDDPVSDDDDDDEAVLREWIRCGMFESGGGAGGGGQGGAGGGGGSGGAGGG